jgi:hypothetical protein
MGINKFSDMSAEEFKATLGFKRKSASNIEVE